MLIHLCMYIVYILFTHCLQWPCINDAKVNKKKYENSGVIFLTACEVNLKHT